MNAEVFAKWMRLQGFKVVHTKSSYWYDTGYRVFQAFPYHWVINPSEDEIRRLLVDNNAIALRFSAPLNSGKGKVSYHVVCDDPDYDIKMLPRQARQNVKRGSKNVRVEQIPISRLVDEGWRLRKETLERQGREGAETRRWWVKLCRTADKLPGFEAWGAMCENRLVASFLGFRCDKCYILPYEQSETALIKRRVNNAIFYHVTQAALKRGDVASVFYGLESLDAPASVDQFKFRMGYMAMAIRQRVVFHPLLVRFANGLSHKLIARIVQRYPGNYFLTKAEGMLRFHLQGKMPIWDQHLPDVLEKLITCPEKTKSFPAMLKGHAKLVSRLCQTGSGQVT